MPPDYYKMVLPKAKVDVTQWPGMIVGVGVVGITKDRDGRWHNRDPIYQADVKLTVMALKDQQAVSAPAGRAPPTGSSMTAGQASGNMMSERSTCR